MSTLGTFLAASLLCGALSFALWSWLHVCLLSGLRAQNSARPGRGRALAGVVLLVSAGFCCFLCLGKTRPILGLAGLILGPLGIAWRERRRKKIREIEMDRSAVIFFHSLRSLLQAGVGLPHAFFLLSESLPGLFTENLRARLQSFEQGKPLGVCLESFRKRVDLKFSGIVLEVLELAYRQGLPLVPFLDRVLPTLEAEAQTEEKIRSLRRSALGQAGAAALLPWGLGAVVGASHGELLVQFPQMPFFFSSLFLVLGWEALGVWCVYRTSEFY